MEELLKQFPKLPFDVKPKILYMDGSQIVGIIEEEKFVGFAKWDGFSVSFADYKVFPKMN